MLVVVVLNRNEDSVCLIIIVQRFLFVSYVFTDLGSDHDCRKLPIPSVAEVFLEFLMTIFNPLLSAWPFISRSF